MCCGRCAVKNSHSRPLFYLWKPQLLLPCDNVVIDSLNPELNALPFENKPFREQEVMPMSDSSKCLGRQIEVSRLCVGAVL